MSHQERITEIKAFWNEQAEKHASDLAATNPDPLAKELELEALQTALDPERRTLEAGCGNGYNLFALSSSISGELVGFDYAPEMIRAATDRLQQMATNPGISFHVANIVEDLGFLGQFDQIFTDRCLINLPSLELQLEAVANLSSLLHDGGRLVLVESTWQGQERLNSLREQAGLEPIPYHWHNLYLDEELFLRGIPSSLELVEVNNFSSLYFVASRVFNAKLTPEGEQPDYLSEINKIARTLPSFGDYGPLKLFSFRKIA